MSATPKLRRVFCFILFVRVFCLHVYVQYVCVRSPGTGAVVQALLAGPKVTLVLVCSFGTGGIFSLHLTVWELEERWPSHSLGLHPGRRRNTPPPHRSRWLACSGTLLYLRSCSTTDPEAKEQGYFSYRKPRSQETGPWILDCTQMLCGVLVTVPFSR